MKMRREYVLGLCAVTALSISAVSAASFTPPSYPTGEPVFTPTTTVQTPVPVTPVQTNDPVRTLPIIPVQQVANPGFINPIPVPTDVIYPIPSASAHVVPLVGIPQGVSGIAEVKDFPSADDLNGPTDFILVQSEGANDGNWNRESPYMVNLLKGEVLASVKRPSNVGMIHTPIGNIALSANTDAFISYDPSTDVLRVRNIDGMGTKLKVNLTAGPFTAINSHTYTLAPGFELVASTHKLQRPDLRPHDAIARRTTQVFADGYCGISQYNVESALNASTIVGNLVQAESDAKTHRVISDMSKMAAVLNVVHGQSGYARD